jgi:hypothetical protein
MLQTQSKAPQKALARMQQGELIVGSCSWQKAEGRGQKAGGRREGTAVRLLQASDRPLLTGLQRQNVMASYMAGLLTATQGIAISTCPA